MAFSSGHLVVKVDFAHFRAGSDDDAGTVSIVSQRDLVAFERYCKRHAARINGTDATDHGTATVAILAGGALKGGRVIADWPGVNEAALYERRDLKPTTDLRAVLKGLLKDHVRVSEQALASSVFPGSANVKPMVGLTV